MKNEFNKTNFIQDEILLHEANFQAKKCNSFHFSTISFNNFQIKLILILALFIIFIFTSNNSYAFDRDTQFDLDIINNKFGSNFSDLHFYDYYDYLESQSKLYTNQLKYCDNVIISYFHNDYATILYFYFYISDYVCFYNYSSPILRLQNPSYLGNVYNVMINYDNNFNFINCSSSPSISSIASFNKSYSHLSSFNPYSDTTYSTLYDFSQLSDFTFNVDNNFIISQDEGGDIDMTEVTNAIDTNSNIQVLILFFLISMFVYLIFYTVANAGRRNK